MAKLASVLFLCCLALSAGLAAAGLAAAGESSSGSRELLAKRTTVELDWRAPHGLELTLALSDRLRLYWDWGEPTGVVQMKYPGNCANGLPMDPLPAWSAGITAKGPGKKMMAAEEGRVTLTFDAAGSFFFTSPAQDECDPKWLRVKVVA